VILSYQVEIWMGFICLPRSYAVEKNWSNRNSCDGGKVWPPPLRPGKTYASCNLCECNSLNTSCPGDNRHGHPCKPGWYPDPLLVKMQTAVCGSSVRCSGHAVLCWLYVNATNLCCHLSLRLLRCFAPTVALHLLCCLAPTVLPCAYCVSLRLLCFFALVWVHYLVVPFSCRTSPSLVYRSCRMVGLSPYTLR
jgi:hypothetical protein